MPLSTDDDRNFNSALPDLMGIGTQASTIANHLWSKNVLSSDDLAVCNSQIRAQDKMRTLLEAYKDVAHNLEPLKEALRAAQGYNDQHNFNEIIKKLGPSPTATGSRQLDNSQHLSKDELQRLDFITPTLARDGNAFEISSWLQNIVFNDNDVKIIRSQPSPGQRMMKLIEIYKQKATSLIPLRKVLLDNTAQPHIVMEMDNYFPGSIQTSDGQSPQRRQTEAEQVRGSRAVDILESGEISTLFNSVDPRELLPELTPWFIRRETKDEILASLTQTGRGREAGNNLLIAIIKQFRDGDNKTKISIQDLVVALKRTRKHPDLIAALENAIK